MITLLKTKLWSSNPFSSANLTNEDRCQIAAKIARFNSENSKIVGQKFTKFGYDVPDYCHWTIWKWIYDWQIRCRMPKQRVKVILCNADCTTSYVLNSGVTEPNLTKFLQGVQKWLLIALLESKLRSSNPFGNANVTNEDRHQMRADRGRNCAF